jgi:hypothetical protein
LAAHATVEEQALHIALDESDGGFDPVIAELLPDRMEEEEGIGEIAVEPFEEARIAHGPEADGVGAAGAAIGRDA